MRQVNAEIRGDTLAPQDGRGAMIGKQKAGTSGKADRSVLRLKCADHRESAYEEPE